MIQSEILLTPPAESPARSGSVVRLLRPLVSGLALIFICSCRMSPSEPPETQPNIVLIVVDALRASNVSFLGYSRDTTPNLDALASESYVFSQAISVAGNTPSAMSGIMTGHYPSTPLGNEWTSPIFGMSRFYADSSEKGLPRSLKTLAEQLDAEGYNTAGFITNPHLKSTFGFHRGFDHFEELFRDEGVPYGNSEMVSQAVAGFLRSATNRPLFLYLHFMDTHGPYLPPVSFQSKFKTHDQKIEGALGKLFWRWEKEVDLNESDGDALADLMHNAYDSSIFYTDYCIGEVIQYLVEMNLMDDTVIVVTADHGEEFLEHGGTTHKGTLYDEIVRVPLLIRIPGKDGGRISDLVRNFDLMPTLLALAGVDVANQGLDAVDLRPLLDGEMKTLRLVTYASFPWVQMLRSHRYKFLRSRNNKNELYDLEEDPAEQRNLYSASSHQETKIRMETALTRLLDSFQNDGPFVETQETELDPITREQLRTLGYLDDSTDAAH